MALVLNKISISMSCERGAGSREDTIADLFILEQIRLVEGEAKQNKVQQSTCTWCISSPASADSALKTRSLPEDNEQQQH